MNKSSKLYNFLKKCETPLNDSWFWLCLNFLFNAALIVLGRCLLNLRTKKVSKYIVFSTMSVGDTLLLYRSLNELKKENGFINPTLIVDKHFYKTFTTLGVESIMIMQFWEIMAIDKAIIFAPQEYPNIVISTPWYFFNIHNINREASLNSISCTISQKSIQSLFPNFDMKNKSVILSPYEQSFQAYDEKALPNYFWNTLARKLKQKGFYVFTNCDGVREKPIEGTDRIFPSLSELAGAAEYAGFCVALCSGFADWISSANLNKEVILYPSQKYLGHFSRKTVWGKNAVCEIVYGDRKAPFDDLIDDILSFITQKNEA